MNKILKKYNFLYLILLSTALFMFVNQNLLLSFHVLKEHKHSHGDSTCEMIGSVHKGCVFCELAKFNSKKTNHEIDVFRVFHGDWAIKNFISADKEIIIYKKKNARSPPELCFA